MWSIVNVLTNSIYILDLIRRDIFQRNLSWIKGKLREKGCRADLSSAWDPLKLWPRKGVLKHELFGIQGGTFFGVNNFKNISAIKLILFSKMYKMSCRFQKCYKTFRNCFWFLRKLRLNWSREFLSTIRRILVINHQRVSKKIFRFWIWFREMFPKPICLRLNEH